MYSSSMRIAVPNIEFLYSPAEFYARLLSLFGSAKRRISIATLYIGNSEMERQLLSKIAATGCPTTILLDGLRGNRKEGNTPSSVELIRELVPHAKLEEFVTPRFRGPYKFLPNRIREVVGTQHMKLVVVDDTVLITGANLSEIYFTNRQDRYTVVANKTLADQVDFLIRNRRTVTDEFDSAKVGSDLVELSFRIQRGFDFPQTGQRDSVLASLLEQHGDDTETVLTLSSPYLNLSPDVFELISRFRQVRVITNSIETNAFFNSKGPSKFIPEAYAILQDELMSRMHSRNFSLLEFSRPGWSFHPKGVWLSRKGEIYSTIIGSSNFGYRSLLRDFEVTFAMQGPGLHPMLHRELEGIVKHCTPAAALGRTRSSNWLRYLVRGPMRSFL